MPKTPTKIDLNLMQNILDGIKENQFNAGSNLFKFVADEYNRSKNHNEFKSIDFQLVGLRLRDNVVKLNFPLPVGRRGKQPGIKLSPEHKEKLISGRKSSLTHTNSSANNQTAIAAIQERWGGQFNKLVAGAIRGNKNACIKLNCIVCVGADKNFRESIRECSAYTCPMYQIRPFQKKDSE